MANTQAQSLLPLNYAPARSSPAWLELLTWMIVLFLSSIAGGWIGYRVVSIQYTSIALVRVEPPHKMLRPTPDAITEKEKAVESDLASQQRQTAVCNSLKSRGTSLTPSDLRRGMTVSTNRNGYGLISVSFTSSNPTMSAVVASALATSITDADSNAQIVGAPSMPVMGNARTGAAAIGTIAGFALATLGLFLSKFGPGRRRQPTGRPVDL